MTRITFKPLGLAGAWLAAATLSAQAAPVFTLGSGTAVAVANATATFEGNTGLASTWTENGLKFVDSSGSTDNGGCGYAAALCGGVFSDAFSGNYFGSNDRGGAYISISAGTDDMKGIELAISSGYLTVYGRWQTWLDGAITGTGVFTIADAIAGAVIGVSDSARFDELRLWAFNGATAQNSGALTGFSNPYIDSVAAAVIPVPATPALALTALGLLGATRRRARR